MALLRSLLKIRTEYFTFILEQSVQPVSLETAVHILRKYLLLMLQSSNLY